VNWACIEKPNFLMQNQISVELATLRIARSTQRAYSCVSIFFSNTFKRFERVTQKAALAQTVGLAQKAGITQKVTWLKRVQSLSGSCDRLVFIV
jgi:UDP-3-O-[3-hydroxymyristoyl] glucosamine N-acyltransferase